ncbi:MAG: LamG domain-containing protein [Rickettsiales bacterium]|jgi:hypothetical protein|nr:LamG domain-containing protein [Rickettsiales bacterium]
MLEKSEYFKKTIKTLCLCIMVLSTNTVSADIASVSAANRYILSNFNYTPISTSNIASNTYLLKIIDQQNAQHGCISSHFADQIQSRVIANTYLNDNLRKSVIKDCASYYPSDGLIMNLDFSIPVAVNNDAAFDVAGQNNVTIFGTGTRTENSVSLNNAGSYMRTTQPINLTSYEHITVEVRFKLLTTTTQCPIFESSKNWNNQAGGFGIWTNTNSSPYAANMLHGNHNGSAVFDIPNIAQTDLAQHTVTEILSSNNLTNNHKLFYDGEHIRSLTGNKPFRNDYIWFGQRGDSISGAKVPGLEYYSIRIYNRALTDAEICSNAWKDYNRFGGTAPNCVTP